MLRLTFSRLALGIALWVPLLTMAEGPKRQIELVSATGHGFHFDGKTGRYFSDGKSSFIIRPVEDPKYLEKIEVSQDEGDYRVYEGKLSFDSEGFHLIRFRASDPVLNWSPLQEFRIYVDLTAPRSFPYWHGPSFQKDSTTFVSSQSVLQISAQDTVSGVSQVVWKDGEQGKPAGFPGQMSFKGEGERVLQFFGVDNVGNREEAKEIRFAVDGKAPSTAAEIKGQTWKFENGLYVSAGSEVVLNAQDPGAGVKVTEYQINGGLVTEYRHPIPMTEKKIELRFRSQDQVGNYEAWKTMTVLQDTQPPLVSLEKQGPHMMSGGRIYAAPGFGFGISAKDDETGLREVMVSRDGKTFEKAPGGRIAFTQPGEFHFFAKAIDRVGNTAEANPYTVIIDNQAPKSTVKKTRQARREGRRFHVGPSESDRVHGHGRWRRRRPHRGELRRQGMEPRSARHRSRAVESLQAHDSLSRGRPAREPRARAGDEPRAQDRGPEGRSLRRAGRSALRAAFAAERRASPGRAARVPDDAPGTGRQARACGETRAQALERRRSEHGPAQA
jgi:hypothetical protein